MASLIATSDLGESRSGSPASNGPISTEKTNNKQTFTDKAGLPLDPPFTINDLKAAIPAHCFERSLKKSFTYVAIDLALVALAIWLASFIPSFSWPVQFVLWPAYWVIQGFTFTGIWVIAHECGHQAFSDSKAWNNAVGLVLHSALLVPYHSWRFTHGNHHKATGHLTRDQVFVPSRYSKVMQEHSLWEDTPLMNLYKTFIMVFLGWPFYLMFNVLSQPYPGQRANHFEPWSPLFKSTQRQEIVISDISLAVVFGLLYMWSSFFSFSTVFFYYVVPYFCCNFWLVTITYLQHTHVDVPHYTNDEWTFIKGALTTIDRDYGILNYWFHHIQDTHILHHLFSTIPHYNAEEATEAIKPILGKYYRFDNTPILKALWETRRQCKYIDDEGSVLFYRTNVKKD